MSLLSSACADHRRRQQEFYCATPPAEPGPSLPSPSSPADSEVNTSQDEMDTAEDFAAETQSYLGIFSQTSFLNRLLLPTPPCPELLPFPWPLPMKCSPSPLGTFMSLCCKEAPLVPPHSLGRSRGASATQEDAC